MVSKLLLSTTAFLSVSSLVSVFFDKEATVPQQHPKSVYKVANIDDALDDFSEKEYLEDIRTYIMVDAVECDVLGSVGFTTGIIFGDDTSSVALEGNVVCTGDSGTILVPSLITVYLNEDGESMEINWALTQSPISQL